VFQWTGNTHHPSHPRLQIEFDIYAGVQIEVQGIQSHSYARSALPIIVPTMVAFVTGNRGNPARFFPPVSTWQRITERNTDDKQLALAALARKFLCAWLLGYLPVNFHITDGKITSFNGKIHYFYGHVQ